MKALWQNELWVVIENYADQIELEALESEKRVRVDYADPTLVIDPTDGELDEADAFREQRSGCCDCPHENYLTVSVALDEHQCQTCGETFIDPHRTKRYFGRAAEQR